MGFNANLTNTPEYGNLSGVNRNDDQNDDLPEAFVSDEKDSDDNNNNVGSLTDSNELTRYETITQQGKEMITNQLIV